MPHNGRWTVHTVAAYIIILPSPAWNFNPFFAISVIFKLQGPARLSIAVENEVSQGLMFHHCLFPLPNTDRDFCRGQEQSAQQTLSIAGLMKGGLPLIS